MPLTAKKALVLSKKYTDDSVNGGDGKYALSSEAASKLGLSIDSGYVLTVDLKNKSGEVISSDQIDFPMESMIVDVDYDKTTKKMSFTLQNGKTLDDIDLSDIVSGLVKDTFTIAGIDMKDNITAAELINALSVVTKAFTIAGINMNDNITVAELKSALSVPNAADFVSKAFTIAGVNMQDPITASELKLALNVPILTDNYKDPTGGTALQGMGAYNMYMELFLGNVMKEHVHHVFDASSGAVEETISLPQYEDFKHINNNTTIRKQYFYLAIYLGGPISSRVVDFARAVLYVPYKYDRSYGWLREQLGSFGSTTRITDTVSNTNNAVITKTSANCFNITSIYSIMASTSGQ